MDYVGWSKLLKKRGGYKVKAFAIAKKTSIKFSHQSTILNT